MRWKSVEAVIVVFDSRGLTMDSTMTKSSLPFFIPIVIGEVTRIVTRIAATELNRTEMMNRLVPRPWR